MPPPPPPKLGGGGDDASCPTITRYQAQKHEEDEVMEMIDQCTKVKRRCEENNIKN
jgi:hypothetical protein